MAKDGEQLLNLAGLPHLDYIYEENPFALDNENRTQEDRTAFVIGLCVFSGIVLPLIIVGNSIVIIAIIKEIRKGHGSSSFILSLATCDLLTGIFVAPPYVYYKIQAGWNLGRVPCIIWLIGDWAIASNSQLMIFLITLDRYFKVTIPIKYRNWRTPRKINTVIVASWIACFLFYASSILFLEPHESIPYSETICMAPVVTHQWLIWWWSIIQYFIPSLLMIFFYWRIYKVSTRFCKQANQKEIVTHNHPKPTTTHSVTDHIDNTAIVGYRPELEQTCTNEDCRSTFSENDENSYGSSVDQQTIPNNILQATIKEEPVVKTEALQTTVTTETLLISNKRSLFKISLILGAYLSLSSPLATLYIILPFCTQCSISPIVFEILYGLYYINSAINPFLYAKGNKAIWKSVNSIVSCKR